MELEHNPNILGYLTTSISEIDLVKQGQDLEEHIAALEKKMLDYAAKLEFEDAGRIRDEVNRLKAKQVGLPNKILEIKKR